jgi:hypothetical protein
MQKSYYIFNDDGDVLAIFKNEEFARDYLDHMGLNEDYCGIGMLSENVYVFEEHNAKYYMESPTLKQSMHKHCRRFKQVDDNTGYCFLTNEMVAPYDKNCTMIEEIK